jgi:pyruvate carboxylase
LPLLTPGSDGIVEIESDAIKIARKIGYPVMTGGRWRGRIEECGNNKTSLQSAFTAPSRSEKAFGNDQVYLKNSSLIRIMSNFRLLLRSWSLFIWVIATVPFSDATRR